VSSDAPPTAKIKRLTNPAGTSPLTLPYLLALPDRLLPRDHEHREPCQLGICRRRREVGGARAQGRKRHPALPRDAAHGGGHEPGGLLMAREDQLDARVFQGVEEVQVLFSRDACVGKSGMFQVLCGLVLNQLLVSGA
jgi:hypothetical protein